MRNVVIISIIALIIGVLIGFFVHDPFVDATGLHAAGLVSNNCIVSSGTTVTPPLKNGWLQRIYQQQGQCSGIWTGSEYTYPWQWTPTQWDTFTTCIGETPFDVNHGPAGEVSNNFWIGDRNTSRWSACAASAIANSAFKGTSMNGSLSLSGTPIADIALTISSTGDVTGVTSVPTPPSANATNNLPTGTTISGTINPGGEIWLTVGTLHVTGFVINTNTSTTPIFSGSLINTDQPTTTYVITWAPGALQPLSSTP